MDDIETNVLLQLVDRAAARQGQVDMLPVHSAEKVGLRDQIRAETDDELDVDADDRPDHPPS